MRSLSKGKAIRRGFFLLLILVFTINYYVLGSLADLGEQNDNSNTTMKIEDLWANSDTETTTEDTTTEDDTKTTTEDDTETTTEDDTETTTEDEEDDDGDGVDDDLESEAERELQYEQSDAEFKIESEQKTGENKDKFIVSFKLEDEPEIRFEYQSESDDVETELELKLEFISLIEFEDSNGNGYLDENDVEYSTYEFEDVEFEDLKFAVSTTSDGELLYQVWTQTADGVFLIRMYLVSGFGTINGSIITPTQAKIDIEIHDYAYASQGDLGLRLRLNTEAETEIEKDAESPDEIEGYAVAEEALALSSFSSYLGFFSWATIALVDSVERQVISGPFKVLESEVESEDDEDETETELKRKGEITLVYSHGIHIIHDPKIGIVTATVYKYIQVSIPTSFLFLEVDERFGSTALTIIGTLVVGLLVFLNRRQRRL
ncbi:MAG: hypothetical protein ACXAEL_10970 [Candidatus Hodarchaeales archaeon]|jgi:hypothetical protein